MSDEKLDQVYELRMETPMDRISKSSDHVIAIIVFRQNAVAINQFHIDAAVGYFDSEIDDVIEST